MAVKIPIRDLPKYMQELGDAFGPAILAGLTSAAAFSVSRLVMETDRKNVVNTRQMVDAWQASRAMSTGPVSAKIRVYNDAPYSGVMELGRRAGRRLPWLRDKPVQEQPLYLWAKSKLGLSDEEAARAAWPLAWAIKHKGIKGRLVMTDILDELSMNAAQEVAKELRRAVGKARRAAARAARGLPPMKPRIPKGGS
jgi:hypothetical protein